MLLGLPRSTLRWRGTNTGGRNGAIRSWGHGLWRMPLMTIHRHGTSTTHCAIRPRECWSRHPWLFPNDRRPEVGKNLALGLADSVSEINVRFFLPTFSDAVHDGVPLARQFWLSRFYGKKVELIAFSYWYLRYCQVEPRRLELND